MARRAGQWLIKREATMVVRLLMHPLVEDVFVFLSLALILLSAGLVGSLLWSQPSDDGSRSSPIVRSTASVAPVVAPADPVSACLNYSGFVTGTALADCKR
jgi:hypothetical protein